MAGETITYPIRVAHCPLVAVYTRAHAQMASLATRIFTYILFSLNLFCLSPPIIVR
jgi:hypothetical protein